MPLLPELIRPWSFLGAKVREYRRQVAVDFTVRGYRVKTVETAAELRQVLALRRSVFHYEFARKWISLKSDQDAFDLSADHLAIFDEEAGKIAGVYRLIPSFGGSAGRFYSSTEFDVGGFLATPGTKVELSRACINREYRNGIVISLLWRGLGEYARAAGIDYLFGLSSITDVTVPEIARIHRWFEAKGLVDLCYGITPRAKYRIDGLDAALAAADADPAGATATATDPAERVPSLFKTYIKAGAKVCSQPVIDRDFNCADWLTVLNMQELVSSYGRKYR
jgi:putative hemolysin